MVDRAHSSQSQEASLTHSLCIHQLFEAQVVRSPDAVALVFGNKQLTYHELNERANQMARFLTEHGIGRESRVVICVPWSLEIAIGLLGVLKAGAVYVPLDCELPQSRRTHILEDTGAQCVLTQGELLNYFQGFVGHVFCFDHDRSELENQEKGNLDLDMTPECPVYVMYTSGSTGMPKGVLGHHQGVENYFEYLQEAYHLNRNDVILQLAPFTFDASLRDLIGPLTSGSKVVLVTQEQSKDPETLLSKIKEHQVTGLLSIVPTRLNSFLEATSEKDLPYDSIRLMLISGEPLYSSVCHKVRTVFGKQALLVNQYGPTECTMTSTYFLTPTKLSNHEMVSIGIPIPHSQLYLLDSNLTPVPVGMTGEVYISGPGLTWGYLNLPALTADKFRPNPFDGETSSRLYKTGDLARLDPDGTLHFSGRVDRQVKVNGVRIELGEIESVLRRHQAVQHCTVGIRDAGRVLVAPERLAGAHATGSPHKHLVAYIVCRGEVSHSELRRFLKEHLPDFMIPQKIVQLEALPLNANGKVDTKALPEPENLRPQLAELYVAPRDEYESKTVEVWEQVLNLNRIGVNDDFFDLGGDSLKALQIINRLRQTMTVNLTFGKLLAAKTVKNLARLIRQATPTDFKPIRQLTGEAKKKHYPLSFAEQGIWFLWKLAPDNPYYIARGLIKLRGNLDLPVFRQAWQALVERHEMLRVRFGVKGSTPIQMFKENPKIDLPIIDVSHLPEEERVKRIQFKADEEIKQPFDLENDELLRSRLFRLSNNEHALLLIMHEIIIDIWSIRVLLRDLGILYQGFLEGKISPLAPLNVNFRDFVLWERKHIRQTTLATQDRYWRRELIGELPITNLPFDRPRPKALSYRGKSKSLLLGTDLTRKIKTLCCQEEVTLFTALLTAFNVLLHAYSGQKDLIIGVPIANRHSEAAEQLIGFCLNMLPLRVDLSGDPNFTSLLGHVKSKMTGGLSNADYPFMWMLDLAKSARDSQVSPIFQVMFNMLSYTDLHFKHAGLEMEYQWFSTPAPKYDLSLYAQEYEEQIYLQHSYSPDLFEDSTIARMLNNFRVILESIVEHPEWPLSKLEILSEPEKKALLYGCNQTDRDYHNNLCLHELFERQVKRTPDRTALIFEGSQLSYSELDTRANQLAHFLRRHGVGPENFVAVCLEPSLRMIETLLAIMKAGGVYVALDPHHPMLRLQDILNDTNPSVLLLEKNLDRFESYTGTKVFLDDDWNVIEKENSSDLVCWTTPKNLLNVVYTSSSTGKPKGTLITIEAVLNRLFWMWRSYPFCSSDVAVLQKSYALVAATWECFGGLLAGVPTLILPMQDVLDAKKLWEKLVSHQVSYLLGTPPLLENILDQEELHPECRTSLRLATTGAESLQPELALRWRKSFPQTPLLNLYGSTECSSNATGYDTAQVTPDCVRVPIGAPLPNTQVYVLDKDLQPVPTGVVAELFIAGACLARGYLNRPDGTANRFFPNPYSSQPGSRLLQTGDLARYRADGTLELVGRKDHQVKIRGFRIELEDVEAALLQHDRIEKCAVSCYPKNGIAEGLIAYVMTDEPLPSSGVRQFLEDRVPQYMVPSWITRVEALPLTPNGKIDRRRLPEPTRSRGELDTTFKGPRTLLELQLVRICQEILGVHPLGITDNFFDLGGNSLLAVRLMALIESNVGYELPLAMLFQAPTVERLAQMIGVQKVHTLSSRLIKLQPLGRLAPFFCVHGAGGHVFRFMALARHLRNNQPFYGLQNANCDLNEKGYFSIEEMASHYIEAIRTVQAEGPYFLGGWSMGGFVAYEMARQLKRQGQEIAQVVLLDTKMLDPALVSPSPLPRGIDSEPFHFSREEFIVALERFLHHELHGSGGSTSSHTRNVNLLKHLDSHGIYNLDDSPLPSEKNETGILKHQLEFTSDEVHDCILEKTKALGLELDDVSLLQFSHYLQVYMLNIRAMRNYVPLPYEDQVIFFTAREENHGSFRKSRVRLNEIIGKRAQVYEVPGNHYTMLSEPHVRAVATQLRQCIQAAQVNIKSST